MRFVDKTELDGYFEPFIRLFVDCVSSSSVWTSRAPAEPCIELTIEFTSVLTADDENDCNDKGLCKRVRVEQLIEDRCKCIESILVFMFNSEPARVWTSAAATEIARLMSTANPALCERSAYAWIYDSSVVPSRIRRDRWPDWSIADVCFVWINLDRSLARKSRCECQFELFAARNHRVAAVDGSVPEQIVLTSGRLLPRPYSRDEIAQWRHDYCREIACTLSHLLALEWIASDANRSEFAIVCEDDISFEWTLQHWPDYFGSMRDVLESLPGNADMVHLSLMSKVALGDEIMRKIAREPQFIARTDKMFDAAAFVVSKSAARKILLAKKKHGLGARHEADWTFRSDVDAVQLVPPLFTTVDRNDSTIHPSHLNFQRACKKHVFENIVAAAAAKHPSSETRRDVDRVSNGDRSGSIFGNLGGERSNTISQSASFTTTIATTAATKAAQSAFQGRRKVLRWSSRCLRRENNGVVENSKDLQ